MCWMMDDVGCIHNASCKVIPVVMIKEKVIRSSEFSRLNVHSKSMGSVILVLYYIIYLSSTSVNFNFLHDRVNLRKQKCTNLSKN